MLTNFRLFNSRTVGNPTQEVIDYYARKSPWMVELDTQPSEADEVDEDYIQWRDWIASQWGKPSGRLLSRKESSMRLEICKTCPHLVQKTWDDTDESIEFERKSLMLKRGSLVDEKYAFCSLHRCDVGVASFVENPISVSGKMKDEQDYPACWFTNLGSV